MEMMIVISIISIIAGMSVLYLGPAYQKHNLRLASEELRQHIKVLRMKSIISKTTYQVRVSAWTLFFRAKTDHDWGDWESISLNNTVDYSMKGTTYLSSKGFASPKTILISIQKYRQKLVININGRARISQIY